MAENLLCYGDNANFLRDKDLFPDESVSAGHYHSDHWGKDYPRIQILTIEQLLADPDRPHPRCLRTPPRVLGETFKQAPKHRKKGHKQLELSS